MIGIGIANSIGLNSAAAAPDPEASAYFASTGITGATEQTAIDNLVKGLKQDGLWSKMKAVYPFVTDNRNLLGYTEDFSNAYWTKNTSTITTNATTAPNGTATADKLIGNNGATFSGVQRNMTVTSATVYTISVYLKAAEATWLQVIVSGVTGTSPGRLWIDLTNGVLGTNNGGFTSASIESSGNGWYRVLATFTTTSTSSQMFFAAADGDNINAFTGNGVNGLYLWGAQLELGSTATTYQPIATTQQAFISNQFKYNLVNPVDSDAAFRLVFNGGWTHSAQGALPNGTNGYADTFLVPSSVLTLNDTHLSFYSRTQDTSKSGHDISSLVFSPTRHLALTAYYNSITNGASIQYIYPADSVVGYASSTQGLFISSRVSSTSNKLYRNSSILGTNTTLNTSTLPTTKTAISANNATTAIGEYQNRQTAFASIGDGLTDTEAANLYTRVQAFQTALSRQV